MSSTDRAWILACAVTAGAFAAGSTLVPSVVTILLLISLFWQNWLDHKRSAQQQAERRNPA